MDTNVSLPNFPPQEHTVKRDADRDLAFSGWLIGAGEQAANPADFDTTQRGTEVRIYLTVGHRIVTAVRQWERKSSKDASERNRAATHDEPGGALYWLKKDARGDLGPASKAAWLQACAAWPGLAGEDVERVE